MVIVLRCCGVSHADTVGVVGVGFDLLDSSLLARTELFDDFVRESITTHAWRQISSRRWSRSRWRLLIVAVERQAIAVTDVVFAKLCCKKLSRIMQQSPRGRFRLSRRSATSVSRRRNTGASSSSAIFYPACFFDYRRRKITIDPDSNPIDLANVEHRRGLQFHIVKGLCIYRNRNCGIVACRVACLDMSDCLQVFRHKKEFTLISANWIIPIFVVSIEASLCSL
jgi:hypothetical protein